MQNWLMGRQRILYGGIGIILLGLYGVATYRSTLHAEMDPRGLAVLTVLTFAVGFGIRGGLAAVVGLAGLRTALFAGLGQWAPADWAAILRSDVGVNLFILIVLAIGIGGLAELNRHNRRAVSRYQKAEERLSWEVRTNTAIAKLSNTLLALNALEPVSHSLLDTFMSLVGAELTFILSQDPQNGLIAHAIHRQHGPFTIPAHLASRLWTDLGTLDQATIIGIDHELMHSIRGILTAAASDPPANRPRGPCPISPPPSHQGATHAGHPRWQNFGRAGPCG